MWDSNKIEGGKSNRVWYSNKTEGGNSNRVWYIIEVAGGKVTECGILMRQGEITAQKAGH